jgi:hypothetical protein
MSNTFRKILAFAALFVTVSFLVVLVNQTVQLAEFAERFHPVAGEIVFWGLVVLYLLFILVPFYLFFRLPRAMVPPDSEDSSEFEKHLNRLKKRLSANPLVSSRTLKTKADVQDALGILDLRAEEILKTAGSRVFLSTAISQNGALDSLLVLGVQTKLVWDIAHLYHQRPALRDMTYLYGNVMATAFIAGELDEVDLSEQVQPVISSVLGSAASAVPGLQVASTVFVNSVLSGSANAFLTLRVGIIAREYSRALVRPEKGVLRKSAIAAAAGMLGSIVVSGAAKVSTAIARASGRKVTGAVAGVGSKVKGAGEAVVEHFPFFKKIAKLTGDRK